MPAARQRTNPRNGAPDNRSAALVRAAAQLFREKSFEGTTIRNIAGAIGMRRLARLIATRRVNTGDDA